MSKELIVGGVEKLHAIDYTAIYRITLHKNLPAGAVIELDTENTYVTRRTSNRDVS